MKIWRPGQKYSLPTCNEVKSALTRLGFELLPRTSTSHEKWSDGKHYVTVDCPKSPFSKELILSMAKQAGISKNSFLEYCFNKKKKKT